MAKDLEGAEMFVPQTMTVPIPRPILMPRTGTIPLPTVPGEVVVPPVTIDMPEGVTVGQPQTTTPGEAVRRIEEAGGIDWANNPPSSPDDLGAEWENVTDPDNRGDRTEFKNKNTGEKVGYDPGRKGKPGWEGVDHWHRYNPNKTGKHDMYLDKNGNPVGKGSDASHIEASSVLPAIKFKSKNNWYERNIKNPVLRWQKRREEKRKQEERSPYSDMIV